MELVHSFTQVIHKRIKQNNPVKGCVVFRANI
jgi:hypothetical protein